MIINSFRYLKYLPYKQTAQNLRVSVITSSCFKYSSQQEYTLDQLISEFSEQSENIISFKEFNYSAAILSQIVVREELEQSQKKELFLKLMSKFPQKSEENEDKSQLTKSSEAIVTILQNKIEYLDAQTVLESVRPISAYNAKYFKGFWHFLEFLLTRTNFLNIFQDSHAVELLTSYYEIENTLEVDKYQYIYDKFEEYFCSKKEVTLNQTELAQLLRLYTKSLIGGDMFYRKLFNYYQQILGNVTIPNLVLCNWAFVMYNLRKKDPTLKVYINDMYERISKEASKLNSYQMKQFLWSYHKEKEMFGI